MSSPEFQQHIPIQREAETILPTHYGEFRLIVYTGEHTVLTMGALEEGSLVRIHSENFVGDRFGPDRESIHESMKLIAEKGRGVLIYARNNGRVDHVAAGILYDLGLSYDR